VVAEPHMVLFLIGVTYTGSGMLRWVAARHRAGRAGRPVSDPHHAPR
jgi:hypothetical protein